MTKELRNARAPFSFEEAMEELGLVRAEFIDFVRWAELAVITPIPTGTTASLFYNYQLLSPVPPAYPSIKFTGQVDYLHIDTPILSKIVLGGKHRLSRFELITLSSGQSFSANELYRTMYAQAMEVDTQAMTAWEMKIFGMALGKLISGVNREKWFSIKKTNSIEILPPVIAEPTWVTSPNYENPETNQTEYIDIEKANALFFPEMIYELKDFVVSSSKPQVEHIELSQIESLKKAADLYKLEISKINDFRNYWNKNKDTSEMINYVKEALKDPGDRTLQSCIRVLIDDENLLADVKSEIQPRKSDYPAQYSEALRRLIEAGDSEVIALANKNSAKENPSRSDRLRNTLIKIGFKPSVATHLKVIINGR